MTYNRELDFRPVWRPNPQNMQSYAVLIDGGFAKRRLGTQKSPATADSFRLLVEAIKDSPLLSPMRLHRVYYYDSVPLETIHEKPLEGGSVKFGESGLVSQSKQLFEQLAHQEHLALRLGELAFRGWSINSKKLKKSSGKNPSITSDDLVPNIIQKGVDMRIGMDIAALTLKKIASVIVLVTGDSDFVPAMKFARREGAELYLVPLGQMVKHSMIEHSDIVLDIQVSPQKTASAKAA